MFLKFSESLEEDESKEDSLLVLRGSLQNRLFFILEFGA
jgi:hypothetical protein